MTPDELLQRASEARNLAYAPYSQHQVGAAILATNGQVFTGCNVENASYGLTNCAERTAAFKAISEGISAWSAIAISLTGGGSPCGACRQVLYEFNPDLTVYLGNHNGNLNHTTTISDLLPDAFDSQYLRK